MNRKFLKLDLGGPKGNRGSVIVMKETAEFFGWDKAFPRFRPLVKGDGRAQYETFWGNNRENTPGAIGGKRLRICRSKSKSGQPAGMTHRFRIVGNVSNAQLVELAAVAGDKFEWMTKKNGERIDRETWLRVARKQALTEEKAAPR
jgi:hypothetical protein